MGVPFDRKPIVFSVLNLIQRFIYFSERWLFSTNHKYMVLYIYYLVWCWIIRFIFIVIMRMELAVVVTYYLI
jgi:uncharacterized membrane protein (GlpM family)